MMIANKSEDCKPIRDALKGSGHRFNELITSSQSGY